MELNTEIEVMKNRLNQLIENGMEQKKVYELSVELDKLILTYYRERYKG